MTDLLHAISPLVTLAQIAAIAYGIVAWTRTARRVEQIERYLRRMAGIE